MGLALKNFILYSEGNNIPVGNIRVDNFELTPSAYGTYHTFQCSDTIKLETGDPEISDFWMATSLNSLGGVPIILKGQMNADKIYVTIDIDMSKTALEQNIFVTVGEPWEEQGPTKHLLTFVVDGETISTQELEEGAAIRAPEPEAREGYTFAWADAIPETMPAADLTINGAYTKNTYAVTFIVDGEEFAKYELEYGSDITAPQMEEREGYTFAWTDEIPATVPASNVEIKGAYTPNKYTVTWMLNGEVYTEMSIPFGEAIPDVEVKSDERYTFAGWEYVPETMPAQDVIIVGSLVDGINSVNGSSIKGQNAYNLAGQRVNGNKARGIVIVNGKKILK